jgi:Restriction endonuclease
MKVTWSQLKPMEFEKLCSLILEANDFTDIEWYGKSGGDKGRDLTAKKEESLLSSSKTIAKWVVQCKRYVTKPPTKRDIESFLTDAREHRPDNVLIMITNTLTPGTKDWIESVRRDYSFKIIYWEELALEREVANHRSVISERLPKIYSRADSVTVEEVIMKEEYVFACREFGEIHLVAIDKSSLEQAREEVIEFTKFLKENDVVFTWQQRKKRRPRKRAP